MPPSAAPPRPSTLSEAYAQGLGATWLFVRQAFADFVRPPAPAAPQPGPMEAAGQKADQVLDKLHEAASGIPSGTDWKQAAEGGLSQFNDFLRSQMGQGQPQGQGQQPQGQPQQQGEAYPGQRTVDAVAGTVTALAGTATGLVKTINSIFTAIRGEGEPAKGTKGAAAAEVSEVTEVTEVVREVSEEESGDADQEPTVATEDVQ